MEKKVYYKNIFYFIMGIFSVSFFLVLIITGGYSMRGLLSSDTERTFMDFFDNVLVSLGNPYDNGVTTTPLLLLFYRVFSLLLSKTELNRISVVDGTVDFSVNVKLYQSYWFIFIIYSVALVAVLYFGINKLKNGSHLEKTAFTFLIFTSAPVLFLLERGNGVPVSLVFLILFFVFRDSENKILRELSVISLSVAVGLNLYLILFGALLLRKEKKYAFLRFLLYFLVLFIGPFFLFGGLPSILHYIRNLYENYNVYCLDVTNQLNFTNILILPLINGAISAEKLLIIGKISRIVFSTLSISGAVLGRLDYQKAVFAACFAYGISATADTYDLVFMIIPIILLLNEEREHRISSYGAISLMSLSIAPVVSLDLLTKTFTRRTITLVSSYSIVLLTIFFFITTVISVITKIDTQRKNIS